MSGNLGELHGRVMRGVGWKAATAVVSQISRIAVALILARLLAPHDYGVAGMVLVFAGLVAVFADLALGSALVQRETLTELDLSTVFWTSLGAGIVFTGLGVAASGPIAAFYHEPRVRLLVIALSTTFVVMAVASVQTALLTRTLSFRSLEIRQMAGILAGGAAGVTAAASGAGPWAIILQQVTIAIVSTALLWRFSPWRPSFVFSLDSLRSLGAFSLNVFGTRLLFYVNRNVDNLLIGRFIGAAALGLYSLSYNVMLYPFSQIASPIQEVLFPAFSRMQDERRRMAAVWLSVNRLVGAISVPALVGLVVVCPDFVAVVLGGRWHGAVPVIRVLAWVGLLQSLQRMNSSVLQALDETGRLLRYSVLVLGLSLAGFLGGLHWGVVGVSIGYAISSTIAEPWYSALTSRVLGISPLEILRTLRGVFEAAALMAGVVLALRLALLGTHTPPAARLAACIAAGLVVYAAAALVRVPEIRGLLDRVRRARPGLSAVEPTVP